MIFYLYHNIFVSGYPKVYFNFYYFAGINKDRLCMNFYR
jgi:hypothetical protein